jgi:hypothetical protein
LVLTHLARNPNFQPANGIEIDFSSFTNPTLAGRFRIRELRSTTIGHLFDAVCPGCRRWSDRSPIIERRRSLNTGETDQNGVSYVEGGAVAALSN